MAYSMRDYFWKANLLSDRKQKSFDWICSLLTAHHAKDVAAKKIYLKLIVTRVCKNHNKIGKGYKKPLNNVGILSIKYMHPLVFIYLNKKRKHCNLLGKHDSYKPHPLYHNKKSKDQITKTKVTICGRDKRRYDQPDH